MERIIRQLNEYRGISDWKIIHEKKTGYQLYVIGKMLDNLRKVVTDKYHITIYCDTSDSRGFTTFTIFENDMDVLPRKLKEAVFIAGRVKNQRFSLPGPAYYPFVETFDPALAGNIRDVLFERLADELIDSVEKERNVTLSSSEYFTDLFNIEIRNSRGVELSYRKTEIFFDGVLLGGKNREMEIHFEPRARRLQDLPIREIVSRQSKYLRDSLAASLPPSGRYPVVFSENALTGVFPPLVYHCSGRTQYLRTSRFKCGAPVGETEKPAGEPLTLISNMYIPFGLRTAPADADGVPASRFELIREGFFVRSWCTRQYADYLGVEATGALGNIEIPIGNHSMSELVAGGDNVLHVIAFSALMPDVVSGNFAAEIKFGYMHDRGKVYPVRGGSVSGNLITGFDRAYYSTESTTGTYALSLDSFGTYVGPRAIRFEGFQVSGV